MRESTTTEEINRLNGEIQSLCHTQAMQMRVNVAEGIKAAADVVATSAQPDGVKQLAEKIVRDGDSILTILDQIMVRNP